MKSFHYSPFRLQTKQFLISSFPPHILPKSSCPYIFTPATLHPIIYIQMFKPSTICHVSPHHQHSILKRLYKILLHFLSFNDTPHIHLTTIISALFRHIFSLRCPCFSHHHHHHIRLTSVTPKHTVFQASALARVGPPVIFLQAQRSCAISSFIPIAFMSLLTQLLHVFLGAPLSTTPITFILVHFFTQLFSSFRSTCPNHLNLPLCILFSTHSMPKRFKSSSCAFYLLKTLHTSFLPSSSRPSST